MSALSAVSIISNCICRVSQVILIPFDVLLLQSMCESCVSVVLYYFPALIISGWEQCRNTSKAASFTEWWARIKSYAAINGHTHTTQLCRYTQWSWVCVQQPAWHGSVRLCVEGRGTELHLFLSLSSRDRLEKRGSSEKTWSCEDCYHIRVSECALLLALTLFTKQIWRLGVDCRGEKKVWLVFRNKDCGVIMLGKHG